MKKILSAFLMLPVLVSTSLVSAGERFPEFPVAAKMTAAAKIGNTVYAGLGTAGSAWYAFDMSTPNAQWQALAPFPGEPRDNANAVVIGSSIYVFNGQGKVNLTDKKLVMFDTVWKYDTVAKRWSKVLTRSPLGGLASAAVTLDHENIVFFGGVNKTIFDTYFLDYFDTATTAKEQDEVNARYFNQRPEDYLFTAQVLSYNPAKNQWRNLGIDPTPVTIGAGVAVKGNKVSLIGGEIKPGLRSPNVKSVTVNGEKLNWSPLVKMAAAPGESTQEGISGAYSGYSNNVLLAAGGTNFPGAWKQFIGGQLFAHQGLSKTWRSDIYAEIKGKWKVVGQLPAAMAYGSAIQLDEGVLVIGGELQGGAGSKDVFLMRWNGKSVDIIR
jgi:N-acetylneuraminate epimerase